MGEIRSVGGRLKGRINGRHLSTTVTVVSLSEANINVISRVAKKKKAETLRREPRGLDWLRSTTRSTRICQLWCPNDPFAVSCSMHSGSGL